MSVWEAIGTFINGQDEPRLRPVPHRMMHVPAEDDAFDASLDPIDDADLEDLAVGITYRDAAGNDSMRTIRCRRAYNDGEHVYIQAWCLQREAWRTFRLDRIQEVYDYTTGEILGDAADVFGPLLGAEHVRRAPPPARQMSDFRAAATFRDGARVLLFVALCDDELHSAELDVIVRFGIERLTRLVPDFDDPERAVLAWIDNHVPSRRSALSGLREVAHNDAYAADVAHAMIDVMVADGVVTDTEMDAAWAIQKGLDRAAERRRERP